MSRRTIERNLRSGDLVRLRFGVYASQDACAAVVTAAMHGGTLGCLTAARHAGLWTMDDPAIHVWTGSDGHVREHEGCTCTTHWTHGRPGREFLVPDLGDILFQVYRCAGREAFFAALESARRQGLVSTRQLRELGDRLGYAARRLIAFSRADADSGLESIFRLRLRDLGTRIIPQVRVAGVGYVDFLIDGAVIVELDGRRGHATAEDRAKDLFRDAMAATWGLRTLRFTYAMVMHDWDLVERAVRSALAE